MANNKSTLITSAAFLLLMFSHPLLAEDWTPTKNHQVILSYEPNQTTSQSPNKNLTPEFLSSELDQINQRLTESKYPGNNTQLASAKKALAKLEADIANLASQTMPTVQQDRLWLLKANLEQSEHQFQSALSLLSKIKSNSALYPQSLLVQSRIHLLQGQFNQAEESCKKLISYHTQAAQLCLYDIKVQTEPSSVTQQSLQLLAKRYTEVESPLSRYYHQIIGSYHRQNNQYSQAQKYFSYEFSGAPISQWYQWADMAFENDNSHEVFKRIEGLQQAFSRSGYLSDGLLVRLARAEKNISNQNKFQELASQRIELRERRNDSLHASDIAYYYLFVRPNSKKAVKWAKVNWNNVKEISDKQLLTKAKQLVP